MITTATTALWFLPAVIPISLYVAYSDLSKMIIPNKAVYALVAAFAVLGLLALPFPDYLWRWSHLVVVLVIGIAMNAARLLGAGDAKFSAAAAPFIALGDWTIVLSLFTVFVLVSVIGHRIAKATPLRNLAPDWKSWSQGKRFPMGLPLAATLTGYLVLAVIRG
ncbi:prepilin peptidase [Flavimaricola marinus]|uniref:Type IV leader peptidase family protein n=1 Tax=Flavimaricola marinus TaxID=1819565 RepID=A0A238LA54_9RHOB|nr:prepilin peptidase [Flavimaricola marinus]SMY06597.1 Type IV leader peptidase family protein [Flavimaricola marinus]